MLAVRFGPHAIVIADIESPFISSATAAIIETGTVAALVIALYAEVLAGLAVECWNDPSASQALLIPPLSLLIARSRWREARGVPARRDWRGLGAIAAACLLLLIGTIGAEQFLGRISFVLLLAGLVWLFWGAARLRVLSLPLLLLATAVPLPNLLYSPVAVPLKLLVSELGAQLAQMLNVSVFRDGNIIHLARVSLGVEEACSGLASLSALLMSGVLLGVLMCRSKWGPLALALAAMPVAVLLNVVRIAGTAVLADRNQEFAMGFYHLFSGWLVYAGGLAAMYVLARGVRRFLD